MSATGWPTGGRGPRRGRGLSRLATRGVRHPQLHAQGEAHALELPPANPRWPSHAAGQLASSPVPVASPAPVASSASALDEDEDDGGAASNQHPCAIGREAGTTSRGVARPLGHNGRTKLVILRGHAERPAQLRVSGYGYGMALPDEFLPVAVSTCSFNPTPTGKVCGTGQWREQACF